MEEAGAENIMDKIFLYLIKTVTHRLKKLSELQEIE